MQQSLHTAQRLQGQRSAPRVIPLLPRCTATKQTAGQDAEERTDGAARRTTEHLPEGTTDSATDSTSRSEQPADLCSHKGSYQRALEVGLDAEADVAVDLEEVGDATDCI